MATRKLTEEEKRARAKARRNFNKQFTMAALRSEFLKQGTYLVSQGEDHAQIFIPGGSANEVCIRVRQNGESRQYVCYLDSIGELAKLIKSLVVRYNYMVNLANEKAAGMRMTTLKPIVEASKSVEN